MTKLLYFHLNYLKQIDVRFVQSLNGEITFLDFIKKSNDAQERQPYNNSGLEFLNPDE